MLEAVVGGALHIGKIEETSTKGENRIEQGWFEGNLDAEEKKIKYCLGQY